MRRSFPSPLLVSALLSAACVGSSDLTDEEVVEYSPHGEFEDEPLDEPGGELEHGLVTCNPRGDTGYRSGRAYSIQVVTADGRPAETRTANAYALMQDAAARGGVNLRVISAFRTNDEQRYLYGCYVNCNCNGCTLAARPGYSNHQSGEALDLNTRERGVYTWLARNAHRFGFQRTVPSEPWHWEYRGGGPGGGPCSGGGGHAVGTDGCTDGQRSACGNYGCACVNGACNGGFCEGTGCTAQETANCARFGANCVDHKCNGGYAEGTGCTAKETRDCATFGANCVDHRCNGGYADGTGCTAKETRDCAAFGANCVDHRCNGGYADGTGCTAKETRDCAAFGANCVDHKCSGGFAPGTGCTARETTNCGHYGCGCADHECGGGFCGGSGCTAKQTDDCARFGCGCNAGKCAGGACG